MRKTEIPIPDADALVLPVPLSGALPTISAGVCVVSVDAAPAGLSGWRLLDAMRSRFAAIRGRSEAVVELPVDPAIDGSQDVLALRPELARLVGTVSGEQVEAFVSACRQFDVVAVIPWRWRALAPQRRRCVLAVDDTEDPSQDPVPANWAIRVGPTWDRARTGSVERIIGDVGEREAGQIVRSLRVHREWLDSLEVREPCG